MASDNTTLNPGVGGDIISTELIDGYKVERVKVITGAAGVDGGDVTNSNPFPVMLRGASNPDRVVWISPDSALTVNTVVRLVGTSFNGSTKDPNFWVETVANGGTVVQNGQVSLSTSTNAAGSAKYQTSRKARFVIGSPLKSLTFLNYKTAPVAGNTRRKGVYDANNGFFFQFIGTAFSLATRSFATGSPVDTIIPNGTFNGNYGATWSPVSDTLYKFEIEYGEFGAYWYVNDILLHKKLEARLVTSLTLPATIENINTGSTTNSVFDCYGMAVLRQGPLETASITEYISGAQTRVLKYGAGRIISVFNNDNAGSMIVYDGLTAAGVVKASIDLLKVLNQVLGGVEFSTGLTIVTTGSAKITVNFE